MAINRKSFSATLDATEALKAPKVISTSITGRSGYFRAVIVRNTILEDGSVKPNFMDVLVHPDRMSTLDIAKFDAVQLSNPKLRPVDDPKPDTTYIFASDIRAYGKVLAEVMVDANGQAILDAKGQKTLKVTGLGIYETAQA